MLYVTVQVPATDDPCCRLADTSGVLSILPPPEQSPPKMTEEGLALRVLREKASAPEAFQHVPGSRSHTFGRLYADPELPQNAACGWQWLLPQPLHPYPEAGHRLRVVHAGRIGRDKLVLARGVKLVELGALGQR